MHRLRIMILLPIVLFSFAGNSAQAAPAPAKVAIKSAAQEQHIERAIFAGGCFWKIQHLFSKIPGVIRTRAGYSGGKPSNPTYKEVCTDKTGHAEVVQVEFNPAKVSYQQLLQVFFQMHDPTTVNRQGPDFGTQYRSAIFCTSPEQKKQAFDYKAKLEKEHKFDSPIVTQIDTAGPFFAAEDYHQDYFAKHGVSCE